MRESDLDLLACPKCRSRLDLSERRRCEGSTTLSGYLVCSANAHRFEIAGGIPRFVPAENYASSFGLQWNIHARTQLDSVTGLTASGDRLFTETRWPHDLEGQLVMEAGCGAGRFTEHIAATGARVLSFDFSRAVDACYELNHSRTGLLIAQADIREIPTKPETFDKILCLGVLQHCPDPRAAFLSLCDHLKPGGEIAVDIYRKNPLGKYISFTPAPPSKYWLRGFTKRMTPESLYKGVIRYIDVMWPLSRLIGRIPYLGRRLNWLLLVPDYRHLGLGDELARKWSYLDCFDMLAPAYDQPQERSIFELWFREAGLADIEVEKGHNGWIGRARRPA